MKSLSHSVPITLALAVTFWVGTASAQSRREDFATEPILLLNTTGHHAPIRALVFSADGSHLYSGGDDKVVRVWDVTAATPAPAGKIRHPIWRGHAGAVNTLALSPPAADGSQVLAMAGYGVRTTRGEIGLFGLAPPAGGLLWTSQGFLPSGQIVNGRTVGGHTNPVAKVAFSPRGRILASCGADGTVQLWDSVRRTSLGNPLVDGDARQRPPAVFDLAFTRDGQWLVTGGQDGILRVWDVATRRLLARGRLAAPPGASPINALAITPNSPWVYAGREDGYVFRYPLAQANQVIDGQMYRPPGGRGAIETLAISPDGQWMAISSKSQPTPANQKPSFRCDVDLIRIADGTVTRIFSARNQPPNPSANLVLALAFDPKSQRLAIGGGTEAEADRQTITIWPLNAGANAQPVAVHGQGASIWEVGFAKDGADAEGGPVVAYSTQAPGAEPAAPFTAFALKARQPRELARGSVDLGSETLDGYRVEPVDAYTLRVFQGQERAFDIQLHPAKDRRWYAYRFLPPGPGHDNPALAIACDMGVAIYRLPDGRRTRFLDGHSASVYCLAPSPDRRWLATGSADQTVRLWTLKDCDKPAALGAVLERGPGNTVVVKSVEPDSFADLGGLKAGDVAVRFALDRDEIKDPDTFLANYTKVAPNTGIQMIGRRPGNPARKAEEEVKFTTTLRDAPTLSLFAAADENQKEWVIWTPQGRYDTSVLGDTAFVGWQVNRVAEELPTIPDFFNLRTQESRLRHRDPGPNNLIDRLFDVAVVPPPPPTPPITRPPTVVALAGAAQPPIFNAARQPIAPRQPLPPSIGADAGMITIAWEITPAEGQALGLFEVRLDGQVIATPAQPVLNPMTGKARVETPLFVEAGSHVIHPIAQTNDGSPPRDDLLVALEVRGAPPAREAKLHLLVIAPSFPDPELPPEIKWAAGDAKDLHEFFPSYLMRPDGQAFLFDPANPGCKPLIGADATPASILALLPGLCADPPRFGTEPVRPGDLAVVFIESHVLAHESRGNVQIATAESQGLPPDATVPASELAEALGSLVRRGCKVILFIDGYHKVTPPAKDARPTWDPNISEWVRQLSLDQDVITFLASADGPSESILRDGARLNGAFAGAILDSIKELPGNNGAISLISFQDYLTERVPRQTGDRQKPRVYVPSGIDGRMPLLSPTPQRE